MDLEPKLQGISTIILLEIIGNSEKKNDICDGTLYTLSNDIVKLGEAI